MSIISIYWSYYYTYIIYYNAMIIKEKHVKMPCVQMKGGNK